MDKETLSNYGWIVICVLVLAVMIALATPFGNFVSEAVQSTTKGLFDVNKSALDSTGLINIDNQEFDVPDVNNGGAGDAGYDHNAPELHPDDGSTPVYADVYNYGNYTYTYSDSLKGWKVTLNTAVTDKNQTEYGPILESINGEPIVYMYGTFSGCASMTVAPEIPIGVTDMSQAFLGCKALTTAPAIPQNVTTLYCTFSGCRGLITGPDMRNATSVTTMEGMFNNCLALSDISNIVIHENVTNMRTAFQYCTKITTAPIIPANVKDMYRTFTGCSSLTGVITLNTEPTSYDNFFFGVDMSKVTLAGSCNATLKQTLANTGKNGSQVTIIN